jgi:glycosyltransferase involved in cell wall biosynthesis
MAKIKVLHVIEQLSVGGAEKQLLGLLSRMDRDRFDQRVCYFRDYPDSLAGKFHDAGIPTFLLDKDGMSKLQFFLRLRKAIQEEAPQVVHTWLYVANFWGRWAALTSGYQRVVASDRAEIPHKSRSVAVYERLLAPRTIRLANSEAVAESLYHTYGLAVQRTTIIPNAVSLEPCDRELARSEVRQELRLSPSHRIVLMLGRQAPVKNYPMFLRVGRAVCRQRSDVTFLGIGRQDLACELSPLLSELGMEGRVRLLDQQSDVNRWLAAADVFCFTSNAEGCPNAVLEAMLAGLPIVCTDFASAREVLGDTGVLVSRGDEQAMSRCVLELLDKPEQATHMGERAKRRAQTRYSWAALVQRMDHLYSGLATGSGRHPLAVSGLMST